MAGLGEHITATVRSHTSGDDAAFYSVALQIATREARQGHHVLAANIKKAVDSSRERAPLANVTALPRARLELAELVEASHPQVALRELVAPAERIAQIKQILAEQRQRKNLLEHGFSPSHRLLEGPPGTGKMSLRTAEQDVDLYTPIATQLRVPIATEITGV